MKLSTRLALFATVFAFVLFLFGEGTGLGYDSGDWRTHDWLITGVSIIILSWAAKFIFGSLIDKKAEPKE